MYRFGYIDIILNISINIGIGRIVTASIIEYIDMTVLKSIVIIGFASVTYRIYQYPILKYQYYRITKNPDTHPCRKNRQSYYFLLLSADWITTPKHIIDILLSFLPSLCPETVLCWELIHESLYMVICLNDIVLEVSIGRTYEVCKQILRKNPLLNHLKMLNVKP